MTPQEKVNTFRQELMAIQDMELRKETARVLEEVVPDYFFEIPAASTGKYHPQYAQGQGGLIRHTQMAVRTAIDLATIKNFSNIEIDYAIVALILHDCCKNGLSGSKYTEAAHPLIAAFLLEEKSDLPFIITELISTHMGVWVNDFKTKKPAIYKGYELTKPETELQEFVHECDYIASRKLFEANFNYFPQRR